MVKRVEPDELLLVAQAQAGDRQAREDLVRRFLPLCRRLARRYRRLRLDSEDLIQEACLGLLVAIDRFDASYPVQFASFAYLCIQRRLLSVLKAIRAEGRRAAQEAISLYLPTGFGQEQALWETLPVYADPADLVAERWAMAEISERLRQQLSRLEWAVTELTLAGYGAREIQHLLRLPAKVIDNAHTRVRRKLQRMLGQYGSLLAEPWRPARRRYDLCQPLPISLAPLSGTSSGSLAAPAAQYP